MSKFPVPPPPWAQGFPFKGPFKAHIPNRDDVLEVGKTMAGIAVIAFHMLVRNCRIRDNYSTERRLEYPSQWLECSDSKINSILPYFTCKLTWIRYVGKLDLWRDPGKLARSISRQIPNWRFLKSVGTWKSSICTIECRLRFLKIPPHFSLIGV